MQFLLTFFGGEGEEHKASALLSKKGEGSIESQQKFEFFCLCLSLTFALCHFNHRKKFAFSVPMIFNRGNLEDAKVRGHLN